MLDHAKVKKLIRKLGVTQKEIAEEVNVSQTTVSDWLNGEVQPSKQHLENLAKYLECPIEELVTDTPQISQYGDHSVIFITCDHVINIYGDSEIARQLASKYGGLKVGIDIDAEILAKLKKKGESDVGTLLASLLKKHLDDL